MNKRRARAALVWLQPAVMTVVLPSIYVHAPTWLFVGYVAALIAVAALAAWATVLRR